MTVHCRACFGRGRINTQPDIYVLCSVCAGAGKVEQQDVTTTASKLAVQCSVCAGSGTVTSPDAAIGQPKQYCYTCHGTGELIMPTAQLAELAQMYYVLPKLQFRLLSPAAVLPIYETAGAAGMDVRYTGPFLLLQPGQWAACSTGLAVAIPEGFELQIRPRSGLAAARGVTVLNSPGTIDSDYRGEIKVLLINHWSQPVEIDTGDRIAQLVLAPVARMPVCAVEELPTTARGAGGFGSTGR